MKTLQYIFIALLALSLSSTLFLSQAILHPHEQLFVFNRLVLGYPEILISVVSVLVCVVNIWIYSTCILLEGRNALNDRLEEEANRVLSKQHEINRLDNKLHEANSVYLRITQSLQHYEELIPKLQNEFNEQKNIAEMRSLKITELNNKIAELSAATIQLQGAIDVLIKNSALDSQIIVNLKKELSVKNKVKKPTKKKK